MLAYVARSVCIHMQQRWKTNLVMLKILNSYDFCVKESKMMNKNV